MRGGLWTSLDHPAAFDNVKANVQDGSIRGHTVGEESSARQLLLHRRGGLQASARDVDPITLDSVKT